MLSVEALKNISKKEKETKIIDLAKKISSDDFINPKLEFAAKQLSNWTRFSIEQYYLTATERTELLLELKKIFEKEGFRVSFQKIPKSCTIDDQVIVISW